ncbi:MAG TPA: CpaF/VirB11 family protein [Natronosporangium sp.]|nr:CpaF/VirB11 family protein [Natronosporangium sp.]
MTRRYATGYPAGTWRHDPGPPKVDFATVKLLRDAVSTELSRLLPGRAVDAQQRQLEGERVAARHVRDWVDDQRRAGDPLAPEYEQVLLDAVIAELVGLGRLQLLLADPDVVEVHILGHDQVRVEYADGSVVAGDPVADSDDELLELLQTLARRAGSEKNLSPATPHLSMELPDQHRSRLTAVAWVTPRPHAAIRRHRVMDVDLDRLVELQMLSDPLRDLLRAAMAAGLNIMISGLGGAGKTTLARALAAEIAPSEPIVVMEDRRELGLHTTGRHPWAMSFETRQGHGEQDARGRHKGEVTLADLIPVSLSLGVLRIIVGEVRGREIVAMLEAMTTSRGSLCTIHARNPGSVVDRAVELALTHGEAMSAELAQRMVAGALDLIVYVDVVDETRIGGQKHRYVSHVVEVVGAGERGQVIATELFGPGPDGRAVPKHHPERIRERLRRVGYDSRHLTAYLATGDGGWRAPLRTLAGTR